jgi:hypothetical protein
MAGCTESRARLRALLAESARVARPGTRLTIHFWVWPGTRIVELHSGEMAPREHLVCSDPQDAADEVAMALGRIQAEDAAEIVAAINEENQR